MIVPIRRLIRIGTFSLFGNKTIEDHCYSFVQEPLLLFDVRACGPKAPFQQGKIEQAQWRSLQSSRLGKYLLLFCTVRFGRNRSPDFKTRIRILDPEVLKRGLAVRSSHRWEIIQWQ
jgi:hypothetical protein